MHIKSYLRLQHPNFTEAPMLLSFYASFRWARKRNYILKTVALIIACSLISTAFGLHIVTVLFGPAILLSFPVYGVWDETLVPPVAGGEYRFWMDYYQMRFLASKVYAAEPVGYEFYRATFLSINIGSFPDRDLVVGPGPGFFSNVYLFVLPLLLFLFMNSLGALAGYLLCSYPAAQKSELRLPSFIARVALGLLLIAVAFVLPLEPFDAYAFFAFGITWLLVILGDHILHRSRRTEEKKLGRC